MVHLKVSEAARKKGCTTKYVYDLLAAGRLEGATKVDGVWRIPVNSVDARKPGNRGRRKAN